MEMCSPKTSWLLTTAEVVYWILTGLERKTQCSLCVRLHSTDDRPTGQVAAIFRSKMSTSSAVAVLPNQANHVSLKTKVEVIQTILKSKI